MASLVARYHRPTAGDEIDVVRPEGDRFPVEVDVHWRSEGPGRDSISALVADLWVLELDAVAAAVVDGEACRVGPLRELGTRPGWTVEPAGDHHRITVDGGDPVDVATEDLLLSLEVTMRVALEPFTSDDAPDWVERAREVHPRLVAALEGIERFEPV